MWESAGLRQSTTIATMYAHTGMTVNKKTIRIWRGADCTTHLAHMTVIVYLLNKANYYLLILPDLREKKNPTHFKITSPIH